MKSAKEHVEEMHSIADALIPYTFPLVDVHDERTFLFLKERLIFIDGYKVNICLTKAQYQKYLVSTLQISSIYTPFLPFYLVCKIAQLFLGDDHLVFNDFLRKNQKIYYWTVRYQDGIKMPPADILEDACFLDFKYKILPNTH